MRRRTAGARRVQHQLISDDRRPCRRGYIFRPLVLSLGDLFDRRVCRASFEAKGPMSPYMRDIGLYLVKAGNCGLLGSSSLSTQEARR